MVPFASATTQHRIMSDAKDRRIAELEAKVAELEKRPVLEADVLASFGAFDANGDGYLTKDEVVAMEPSIILVGGSFSIFVCLHSCSKVSSSSFTAVDARRPTPSGRRSQARAPLTRRMIS